MIVLARKLTAFKSRGKLSFHAMSSRARNEVILSKAEKMQRAARL